MKKFLFVFLVPLVALAQLDSDFPTDFKHIFDITKTYNSHYRTIYEVRLNQKACEFYTLDPLRIYWRNAKKGDQVEELNAREHDKLDPIYSVKTAHQIIFEIKSVVSFGIKYPVSVDLVRIGDQCEPLVSGPQHKKIKHVHVVIKWLRARQLIISGEGFDGRPHTLTFDIK